MDWVHVQILLETQSCSTSHLRIRGPLSLISTVQEVRFHLLYPPLPPQWTCVDEIYPVFLGVFFSLNFLFISFSAFFSLACSLHHQVLFFHFTRSPAANIRFQKILCFQVQLGIVWNWSFDEQNIITEGQETPSPKILWIIPSTGYFFICLYNQCSRRIY